MPSDPVGTAHWRRAEVLVDLERRILGGEFSTGSKLPAERDLTAQYSVSRPVVREAIAGLVERGLLDVYPGRGAFVRALGVDHLAEPLTRAARRSGVTARDVVTARLMLETTATALAASRDPLDVAEVELTLEEHERARSLADRARTDLAFHEAVAAASGNPLIVLMFGAISTQVHALMLRSHSDLKVRQLGDPLHREIAEALRKGDADRARDAMSRHLNLALDLYGEDLDRPLADVVPTAMLDEGRFGRPVAR